MRLTAELITESLSYLNPLKERELDLRDLQDLFLLQGHKIPTIENLGVARNQECYDFTDNDITLLANFPLSPRVHTLLCARNRINAIQPTLATSIPALTTLVLTQNNFTELAELVPLREFKKLTHLSLIENSVTKRENYRLWVLYLAPQVRFLDFQKVKDAERSAATELFGSAEEPSEAAKTILSARGKVASRFSSGPNGTSKASRLKLTEREKTKIQEMIRNAKTFAEVQRLEKDLNEGRMPAGITFDDAMDET